MQTETTTRATAQATTGPTSSMRAIWSIWWRHLLSLYIPLQATFFLALGPHPSYLLPFFLAPIILALRWDLASRNERRQPPMDLPAWPFDALVYGLAFLQMLNVYLLARMLSADLSWVDAGFNLLFSVVIVGAASGFSIITAHELIHRPPVWERTLGRLVLCTVLYEHFYTEHIRGHHVRVGTPEDPATARFDETFRDFFRRTVPAQFRSAWRLECERLGDPEMGLVDRRQLQNRVVHGLVVGWGLAFGVLAAFGALAFVGFVLQAAFAFRLLEVVNYFEHYGLTRTDPKRVLPSDSWDTHSAFTYYGLIGLSRHADHHAFASRPYQKLRVWREAPILPRGYVGMIPLVIARNEEFRALARAELERRGLGPFRGESSPASASDHPSPSPTGPAEAATVVPG